MARAVRESFRSTVAAGLACLFASAAGVACYDSRWGETKRAQQHAAAAATPAAIRGDPEGPGEHAPDAGAHVLRIRFRPNDAYLTQTVDARKQISDLVDDANRVLEPTLALTLTVEQIRPWSTEVDAPERALGAIESEDAGQDVELVVGMIGALPRQTGSLHELGVSRLLGKHMVVRAAGRLDERDAIERGFDELSVDDRAQLLRSRKRHRALAVFLHELGHCLGALHEVDQQSLMHPTYDPKMSGFAEGAVALMRIALDGNGRVAIARTQLELLESATSQSWVAADRDQAIALLEAMTRPTQPSATTAARPEAGGGATLGGSGSRPVPPGLRTDDAARFARASELFGGGAAGPAYETAKPLFARYPDSFAIQDLRCQLATLRFLGRDALLAECAPRERLSGAVDGGAASAP